MKKVLVIAPYNYLPWFSGGQKFIGLFLQYLSTETELTVVSVPSNDQAQAQSYKLLPWLKNGFSRYYDHSLTSKITKLVREERFDAVVWEHPYFWWLASRIKKRTGVPAFIHTHNIEFQRFRSMGKWWWPVLRTYEKKAFREADGIFFITTADREFAEKEWKINTAKCIDLPYGIESTSQPDDREDCRKKIAERHGFDPSLPVFSFNGLLSYKPNLDAVRHIAEDIDPLLEKAGIDYRLLISGKDLPPSMVNALSKRTKIIYTGFTDRIDEYVKASDILLNPVMAGGGIKTKMVEAIGWGTTVVSTRTGALGMEENICGNKLAVINDLDWAAFTQALIREAANKDNTPPSYYVHYSWENIVKRIAVRF